MSQAGALFTSGGKTATFAAATPADLSSRNLLTTTTFTNVVATNQTTQSIPSGSFTRIQFNSIVSDTGGNWNSTNNWYVCPVAGVYDFKCNFRAGDASPSGLNFGIGVDVAEQDSSYFFWSTISTSGNGTRRTTAVYTRSGYQNAGDTIRMFAYSDGSSLSIGNVSFSIKLSPGL